MNIYGIAFKNINKRKGKMLLVVISLTIGIASVVSILSIVFSFQASLSKKLETLGYNVVIYPSSSNLSLSFGGIDVGGIETYETPFLSSRDVGKIKKIANEKNGDIKVVSPKFLYPVEIDKKQALLIGVEAAQEAKVKSWWQLDKTKQDLSNTVIVGANIAKLFTISKNESLTINKKKFVVSSVLPETGSQDDDAIFTSLKNAQKIAGKKDTVSVIELLVSQDADMNNILEKFKEALPGANITSIKQAVQYKEKAIGSLANFGLLLAALVVLISGFIIFITMLNSVSERKNEIGIFRAIGFRKHLIIKIILIEAIILSFISGLAGFITGYSISEIANAFMKLQSNSLSITVKLQLLALSILISLTIGVFASMMPARLAARIDPVEALKSL